MILCLSLQASADIFLIEPVELALPDSESLELGQMAVGETLRVVLQRKSGLGFEWDSIEIDAQALPPGWRPSMKTTDKTLVAEISVPADAEETIQRISFTVRSSAQPFSQESFFGYLTVKKNLLEASMEKLKQNSMVGENSTFRLLLNNGSISSQKVIVHSSLPDYWFEPKTVELLPKQTVDLNLEIHPYSYGKRQFSFTVSSALNSFEKSFAAELDVFSTLKGKVSSALFGFPFFTISLLPQFLVNAFLATLS